jgi:hypothetical protein
MPLLGKIASFLSWPIIISVWLPCFLVGYISRRWRSKLLYGVTALARRAPWQPPEFKATVDYHSAIALLDQELDVQRWRQEMERLVWLKNPAWFAHCAVSTYFVRGNLADAIEAAVYGCQLTATKVKGQAEEAKEAFKIFNRQEAYMEAIRTGSQSRPMPVEDYGRRVRQFIKYIDYRRAHRTLAMLQWLAAQDVDVDEVVQAVTANPRIYTPFFAIPYVSFNKDLASVMGMGKSTFSQIKKMSERVA